MLEFYVHTPTVTKYTVFSNFREIYREKKCQKRNINASNLYVKQASNRMYNYNNKNSSTVEIKMVFPQRSPHHHQQQRDQHEAQTPGNCAKLAAEEFATLGKT